MVLYLLLVLALTPLLESVGSHILAFLLLVQILIFMVIIQLLGLVCGRKVRGTVQYNVVYACKSLLEEM